MRIQSKTELHLLKELNHIGLYPKTQYIIDKTTVDFAFPDYKVVIEIDGPCHRTRQQKEADGNRDDFLQSIGWRVRRFTAEETFENTTKVAYKIKQFLNKFQKQREETPEEEPIYEIHKTAPNIFVEKPAHNDPIIYDPYSEPDKPKKINWKKIIILIIIILFVILAIKIGLTNTPKTEYIAQRISPPPWTR